MENKMNTNLNQITKYDGHCALAVSLGMKDVEAKDSCYLIEDGNKYVFANSFAKTLWRVIPGRQKKADANW